MVSASSSAARSPGPQSPSHESSGRLTARQLECLRWAQEGKTAWETGRIMNISPRTVESYLAIAYDKLNVRTRVQAVLRARTLGLL